MGPRGAAVSPALRSHTRRAGRGLTDHSLANATDDSTGDEDVLHAERLVGRRGAWMGRRSGCGVYESRVRLEGRRVSGESRRSDLVFSKAREGSKVENDAMGATGGIGWGRKERNGWCAAGQRKSSARPEGRLVSGSACDQPGQDDAKWGYK